MDAVISGISSEHMAGSRAQKIVASGIDITEQKRAEEIKRTPG